MQELNVIEINEIAGGLAFVPLLAATAAGSFIGGYIAGKISKALK